MKLLRELTVRIVFISLLCAPSAHSQAVPATNRVVAVDSVGLVVKDLDIALRFYRDAIGLEVIAGPTRPAIAAARNAVAATGGARLRIVRLKIPNETFTLELDEYTQIERKSVQANHNDPGSSFMNYGVWDGNRAFRDLSAAHPVVISKSGIPSDVPLGSMAAVWVRDPDGHLIELMQGGWDNERKSLIGIQNVYRSHFGMTETNYQQALSFYKDLLGFDLSAGFPPLVGAGEYMSAKRLAAMVGVPEQAFMTGVAGHCAGARCEMFEFKDAPRVDFHPRLQDPGAAYLAVWVANLEELIGLATQSGAEIVTPGGQPVSVNVDPPTLIAGQGTSGPLLAHSSRQIMIRDPSGFPVLLMQRMK
jgi:catechol 2,3-dioxygenase-like lactoylglutathione lyase family enzyme